jgi:outer membrane protein assembly factor BamB
LDLENGTTLWKTQLPRYENEKKLKDPIVWYGPLLAGNRLITVASNGQASDIDPKTGKTLKEWDTGQNVITAPIIANETLFLLSDGGSLTAWK